MNLKDQARRVAVLDALKTALDEELKTARADLQTGLKTAKKETGTQTIAVDLNGQDIGKATLVQPKPQATVTDPAALLAWARTVAASEITTRLVTEIRPAWLAVLLKQLTAAGRPEWADPETGVIHTVPGVEMQPRAAQTRLTLPDEGKAAIADAWRTGELLRLALPELTAEAGR